MRMDEKRKLGRTDLFVPSLCWGCAPLGNMPEAFGHGVAEEQAVKTLLKAFSTPVTFFDTAGIYGASELRIGRAIKMNGGLPEGAVIATKADRDTRTDLFAARQIRMSVTKSCGLLGLDVLPLVYLHDPEYHPQYRTDPEAVFEDLLGPGGAIEELEKLKAEGVIENIGISGGPIDMLLRFIGSNRFDVVIMHNRWNLLWQTAEPLIKEAHRMGIGMVNAAPYSSGILATGYKKGVRTTYQEPSQNIIDRVKKMEAVCKNFDVPLAAAALQFSLRDTRIHSTVVGIATPEQVEQTLSLAHAPIPNALWDELGLLAIKEGDPESTR